MSAQAIHVDPTHPCGFRAVCVECNTHEPSGGYVQQRTAELYAQMHNSKHPVVER